MYSNDIMSIHRTFFSSDYFNHIFISFFNHTFISLPMQQVSPCLEEMEGETVFQRRRRRPQSVAIQHALVVLDPQGAQDVAQVQVQGQEVQVLEEAQVRQAQESQEVLSVVVVVEEGQGSVEEVQVQGQEVQVLEEEEVLQGPVTERCLICLR